MPQRSQLFSWLLCISSVLSTEHRDSEDFWTLFVVFDLL